MSEVLLYWPEAGSPYTRSPGSGVASGLVLRSVLTMRTTPVYRGTSLTRKRPPPWTPIGP